MNADERTLEMIVLAGTAKSLAYEALDTYAAGDLSTARAQLDEADRKIGEAYEQQRLALAEWAKQEAKAEGSPGLLWMHALDIVMTTITETNLAKRIIDLFEKGKQT